MAESFLYKIITNVLGAMLTRLEGIMPYIMALWCAFWLLFIGYRAIEKYIGGVHKQRKSKSDYDAFVERNEIARKHWHFD